MLRSWNARAALLATLGLGGVALALALRSPLPPAVAAPPVRTARLVRGAHSAAAAAAAATDGDRAPDDEPAAEEPAAVQTGDLPEEPGRRDFEAGMEKVRRAVEACGDLEHFDGVVTVRLTIAKTGVVQSAVVLPPADETLTGVCVLKAARAATFRRFRGALLPTVELTYPFLFRAAPPP